MIYTFLFNDQFNTSKRANKRVHTYLFWAVYIWTTSWFHNARYEKNHTILIKPWLINYCIRQLTFWVAYSNKWQSQRQSKYRSLCVCYCVRLWQCLSSLGDFIRICISIVLTTNHFASWWAMLLIWYLTRPANKVDI